MNRRTLVAAFLFLAGCAQGTPLPHVQPMFAAQESAGSHAGDVVTKRNRGGYAQLAWDGSHRILLGLPDAGIYGTDVAVVLGRKPAFPLPTSGILGITYSSHDGAFYFASNNTLYQASADDRVIHVVINGLHNAGPITSDGAGNIYAADGKRFVKIHNGVIAPISGRGSVPKKSSSSSGAPFSLAFDSKSGSLYFTDTYEDVVKRVLPNGKTAVVAGHCEKVSDGYPSCYPGDLPGRGSRALFGALSAIAYDPLHDRMIVSDAENNCLWELNRNGYAQPVAGYGPSGEFDGNGWHAFFAKPSALTYAADLHAMFFSDTGRVGTYLLTGTKAPRSLPPVQRFALSDSTATLSSPAVTGSSIWFAMSQKLYNLTSSGALTNVATSNLSTFGPMVVDGNNNLWLVYVTGFPESLEGILRVDSSGVQTQFTVPNATAGNIQSLTIGPDGNPWFSVGGPGNSAIGTISNGAVTTYSVPWSPTAVVAGPDGNIWYGTAAEGIGRITTTGTVLPQMYFDAPVWKMAVNQATGDVWILDSTGDNAYRLYSGNQVQKFAFGTGSTEGVDITVTPNDEAWIAAGNPNGIVQLQTSGKMSGYYVPSAVPGISGIGAISNDAIWVTTNSGQVFLFNPDLYPQSGLPYNRGIVQ